jgi:hypothetical protein
MSNKLDDLGKSLELANQINVIKSVLFGVDEEYLKHCIETFRNQASFQDSAAVLNSRYDPTKSTLLNVQAATLETLLSFWNGLKKCEELKGKIAQNDKNRETIESMFF